MSNREEKRVHRRLDMRLPLSYHEPHVNKGKAVQSTTLNISTGGVYFETTDDNVQPGDILAFELAIPYEDNRFPLNGTISTEGRVIRRIPVPDENGHTAPQTRYGIAAQFEKGFKLAF